MANVINRTTKEFRFYVNTPDYSGVDWVINPDLSAVDGQPIKYWKIVGDEISLMSVAEQAAVDADELQKNKLSLESESNAGILKAVIAALVNIINIRLPAGQKITRAEVIDAIRGQL